MRSNFNEVSSAVVNVLYNEETPLSLAELKKKINFKNTLSSLRYFIQKMVKSGVLIPIEEDDERVVYDLQQFFKDKDKQRDTVLELLDSVSEGIIPCIACVNVSKINGDMCEHCDEKKRIEVLKNCLHAYIDVVINEEINKNFT